MSEIQALWVVRHNIATPQGVDRLVDVAARYGYGDLIAQVRGRGDAFYTSALEPRAEVLKDPHYDPLAYLLEKAHGAGLKVHAWLNAFYTWSGPKLPQSPDHVLNVHPDWLMVHQTGRPIQTGDYEGYYLCPSQPAVQAHLWRVYMDIVQRYAVDGVHFDYIRYPGPEFCYCPTCQQGLAATLATPGTGMDARAMLATLTAGGGITWPDQAQYATAWATFRRQQVTDLVGAVYHGVKRVKPQVCVSAAVFGNAVDAFKYRFQDWKGWLKAGILDVVCPMSYSKETPVVEAQIREAMAAANGRPVWAGLGAWQIPAESALEKIAAVRPLGVAGIVLFSYGGITKDGAEETYLQALASARRQ